MSVPSFDRASSNLVGERIELGGIDNDRQIPQPARPALIILSVVRRARGGADSNEL